MKPKADKELNVYGTMQEVTPRLKLEWNLKMRYNNQIRKMDLSIMAGDNSSIKGANTWKNGHFSTER